MYIYMAFFVYKKLRIPIIILFKKNHEFYYLMKNIFYLFLLQFSITLCYANNKQRNKVLLAEQQRYTAMINSDTTELNYQLAPSLIYYHSNGKLDTKQSLINSIATKELVHKKITIEENIVRIYQRKTAIVTGKCIYEIEYHNTPITLHFVFTNVYTKLHGQWILVNRQTTKID
jgi:hypothetical protein